MYTGIFTVPNVGNQTILGLPFTPSRLQFFIDKTVNDKWISSGEATSAANQETSTTHFDVVSTGETLADNTKCLIHRQRQSGILVPVLSFSLVSIGVNRFKINASIADASIPIYLKAT